MDRRHFVALAGSSLATCAMGLAGSLLATPLHAQTLTPRPGWRPEGPREGTPVDDASEGLAREHLPRISLPARPRLLRPFDLVVRIGEPSHPQYADHFIAWVEVAYDDVVLFVTDLSPSVPFPVVRVPVMLRHAGRLTVRAHCTRHGSFVLARALTPT